MRAQTKATCIGLGLVIMFVYLQSIYGHGDHARGGIKPAGLSHDHEHETEEHREYEKNVLLGEEEEGAGYDQLTREEKMERLL